jgi:hypothetical protein
MKKFALIAFASTAALGLAACGSSDDASEDAMADTVEIPADEAMAGLPDPVADEPGEATETTEETRRTAEQAADDAVATVDDVEAAVRDAEAAAD